MLNVQCSIPANFKGILLLLVWLLSGCQLVSKSNGDLPQDKSIQVYFNQRETDKRTYSDPYRHIARPGDNLEAVIIDRLQKAQKSLDLAVLEFNLPEIALALAKKQREGIKVRIILDNHYSHSLSQLSDREIASLDSYDRSSYQNWFSLVDVDNNGRLSPTEIDGRDAITILKNAGIPIIDDTADGSKGSGLMHHKFMVIDGKTVVTGSANYTLSDIHGDFSNLDSRGNVNHLLTIENRDLAGLFINEFNYMWGDGVGGAADSLFGLAKPWRGSREIVSDKSKITVQFAPTSPTLNEKFSTNSLITETLDRAKESISLALFVFSDQKLADTLQRKHLAGITIEGFFDRGFAFRYYSEVLDMLGVALANNCKYEADNSPWKQPLTTVGVPDLPHGDKLHHKFALIDRRIIITGSHNWSPNANERNDETLLIIENATLAEHFASEILRLQQQTYFGLPTRFQNSQHRARSSKCV
jgi:phosphatidylserine/phosphatidylglycerophosphate/cardiolipin synthase-like enzyme